MFGSKAILAVAALAAVPVALASFIPTRNWGVAPQSAPSTQRSQCSGAGSFFISFAGQTYCVSKTSNYWAPDDKDECPLEGWGWHKQAKCCAPPKEVTSCDCGEGYTWSAVKWKCVKNTGGCPSSHWWCDRQKKCLPDSPPKGDDCPKPKYCPTGWYWSKKDQCCHPKHCRAPKPDCDDWSEAHQCCHPNPSPSGHYGGGGGGGYGGGYGGDGHWKKRLILSVPESTNVTEVKKREQVALNGMYCPQSLTACPITSKNAATSPEWAYECLDTQRELESCGGCASTGEGVDCTIIKNAKSVGCSEGKCQIFSCLRGFANNGTACVSS